MMPSTYNVFAISFKDVLKISPYDLENDVYIWSQWDDELFSSPKICEYVSRDVQAVWCLSTDKYVSEHTSQNPLPFGVVTSL